MFVLIIGIIIILLVELKYQVFNIIIILLMMYYLLIYYYYLLIKGKHIEFMGSYNLKGGKGVTIEGSKEDETSRPNI
jgi:hypothetical protein